MSVPRRGLQDIRTLTGKVRKSTLPHEAYLRISHIEMEKARKTVESEKARQLMADIAKRLQEIEAEKEGLLQAVGDKTGHARLVRQGPASSSRGGFKIRY
jgi:parvulin-like peptidyl-prolyl isomerase